MVPLSSKLSKIWQWYSIITRNHPNPSNLATFGWNLMHPEKGSVIQNALLPSIPSHPQIAGERAGKFIVVRLDLNYKLMIDTKNYWLQNDWLQNDWLQKNWLQKIDYKKKYTTEKKTTKTRLLQKIRLQKKKNTKFLVLLLTEALKIYQTVKLDRYKALLYLSNMIR